MVTSLDVAKLAGVSQPTVSRALRGDKRVATATREKVEAAAKALGYVPSAAGRALSSGKTNRIGLLVADLSNEFYRVMDRWCRCQGRDRLVLLAEGGDGDAVAGASSPGDGRGHPWQLPPRQWFLTGCVNETFPLQPC